MLPFGSGWLQNGGGGTIEWSFAPPSDIDAVVERLVLDARGYVLEPAPDEFDYVGHSLPIDGRKRSESFSQRLRQPAPLGVFDFVANQGLRKMLTQDWQEANRVYTVDGWKSTILLCGGVLEGLLLYVLKRRKKRASSGYRQVFPKGGHATALDRWGLAIQGRAG